MRLRLNTTARRRGAVGKTNFAFGKCSRKEFIGVGELSVSDSIEVAGIVSPRETIWASNGSANFSAEEPRPCRMIIVVLWSCKGGMTRGKMVRCGFDFEDDMIEELMTKAML
jgi:hypothetical protein